VLPGRYSFTGTRNLTARVASLVSQVTKLGSSTGGVVDSHAGGVASKGTTNSLLA